MPRLKGSLGTWDLKYLHYWKDRGALPGAIAVPIVNQNTRVATIGSCFAEEIVRVLSDRGFEIAMHPSGLWYNTFSIAQEFEHMFQESPYEEEPLWHTNDGFWIHPFKDYHKKFSSREELLGWSNQIDLRAKKLFTEADVIVITLGLTEIWESIRTGNIFTQLPPPDIFEQGVARFRPSTFQENLANLERVYSLIRKNGSAKIIITVSPVPLYATFRNLDVRIANNISKSTLRTAVAEIVEAHEDVYYFHSYEIVTAVDYPGMFMKEDKRHVREMGVELIMDEFLRTYGVPSLKVKPRDISWLENAPIKSENSNNQLFERAQRWFKRKLSKLLGRAL